MPPEVVTTPFNLAEPSVPTTPVRVSNDQSPGTTDAQKAIPPGTVLNKKEQLLGHSSNPEETTDFNDPNQIGTFLTFELTDPAISSTPSAAAAAETIDDTIKQNAGIIVETAVKEYQKWYESKHHLALSIRHHHGKEGQQRATSLISRIKSAMNDNSKFDALLECLANEEGNWYPNSLKCFIVREVTKTLNKGTSSYTNVLSYGVLYSIFNKTNKNQNISMPDLNKSPRLKKALEYDPAKFHSTWAKIDEKVDNYIRKKLNLNQEDPSVTISEFLSRQRKKSQETFNNNVNEFKTKVTAFFHNRNPNDHSLAENPTQLPVGGNNSIQ